MRSSPQLSAATADIEKTCVSRGSEFLFAKYYRDYLKLSEGLSVTSRLIFKLSVIGRMGAKHISV